MKNKLLCRDKSIYSNAIFTPYLKKYLPNFTSAFWWNHREVLGIVQPAVHYSCWRLEETSEGLHKNGFKTFEWVLSDYLWNCVSPFLGFKEVTNAVSLLSLPTSTPLRSTQTKTNIVWLIKIPYAHEEIWLCDHLLRSQSRGGGGGDPWGDALWDGVET